MRERRSQESPSDSLSAKSSSGERPLAPPTESPRVKSPSPVGESTPTLDVPGVTSIPLSEIEITYARSSGPGGQNVNKVSSKARLRWKLTSGRLAPEVVERFKELYPSWVTESGDVVISSQISRDAPKNRIACLEKLRVAIAKAAIKPKKRIPTKPTRGSVLRRLDAKKRLSNKKRERGRRDFE
ncbi:MAG: aminoacyl-tRNA hydrolase [Thermoguttaceae bacterium]|nr:aminoacyl-tRNA hydrolase [Thermoguttaceae bacterium]